MNLELLALYLPDWEAIDRSMSWNVLPRRVRPGEVPPLPTYGELSIRPGDLVGWSIAPGSNASFYSRLGRDALGLVFDVHWLLDDPHGVVGARPGYYPSAVIAWNDNKCTCSDHRTLRLVSRPAARGIIKSVEQKTKSQLAQDGRRE